VGALTAVDAPLRGRVIGVYGSGGAPWHHLALAASYGAEVRPLRAEDIAAGGLAALDALVMPGGGALAMGGMLRPLGATGGAAIRAWVEAGGCYISSCAGSVLPLTLAPATEALLAGTSALRMTRASLANPGDATLGGLASPGVGEIAVRLDPHHPFAAGLPEQLTLMHYNGPLFALEGADTATRPFAWPLGAEARFTPAEGFLPGNPVAETTLERCIAAGAATGIEVQVGAGRGILFGSHPEFGLGPLLLGWGAGAQLLVQALASCRSPARRPSGGEAAWRVAPEVPHASVQRLAHVAAHELDLLASRFERLAERDLGGWLGREHAASFHGRSAAVAWCEDGATATAVAREAAAALSAIAATLDEADRGWLDDAPRADQDFGAMGLGQLLQRIGAMLSAAERRAAEAPERPAHAYDLFDRHPFHLAVGSYLSAAGLVSAALLTVAILASHHGVRHAGLEGRLWLDPADSAAGRL
jgi:hypothetical protein